MRAGGQRCVLHIAAGRRAATTDIASGPPDRLRNTPPVGQLAGLRVLVVEDDIDARRPAGHDMTQQGAEICQAGTFRSARVPRKDSNPELVLSDIGLPDREGTS